jgi:hypothetical protein
MMEAKWLKYSNETGYNINILNHYIHVIKRFNVNICKI